MRKCAFSSFSAFNRKFQVLPNQGKTSEEFPGGTFSENAIQETNKIDLTTCISLGGGAFAIGDEHGIVSLFMKGELLSQCWGCKGAILVFHLFGLEFTFSKTFSIKSNENNIFFSGSSDGSLIEWRFEISHHILTKRKTTQMVHVFGVYNSLHIECSSSSYFISHQWRFDHRVKQHCFRS